MVSWEYGRVAQLVEQVTFNHWVTGSNPVALTIAFYRFDGKKAPPGVSTTWLTFNTGKGDSALPLHKLPIPLSNHHIVQVFTEVAQIKLKFREPIVRIGYGNGALHISASLLLSHNVYYVLFTII